MSIVTNFARSVKVELIAKLATSYEAYDGGTLIRGVAPHNLRDYFRKYGSTARKFDHIADGDIYIGYVRMSGRPEFLSAIVLAGDNAVAVSFDSAVDESNDFLTLMAKAEFADRMTVAVQRAAEIMRKATSPQPPTPPQSPPTSAVPVKADSTINTLLIVLIVFILAAVLLGLWTMRYQAPSPQPDAVKWEGWSNPPATIPSPKSYPTSGALPDASLAPSTDASAAPSDANLTYGMLDSIMGGIDDFNRIKIETGMIGAEAHSTECHKRARTSSNIADLDTCAAFDFAAQFHDNSFSAAFGSPLSKYFEGSNARLEAAYSRFPESNLQRMAALKGQTAAIIDENSN